jgi:hypothetical protein
MVEAAIEDPAFPSRLQGKPALPGGRECLSTEGTKKEARIFLIVSRKSSDYRGGVPRPPMREVRENVKNLKGARPFQCLAHTKWKRTNQYHILEMCHQPLFRLHNYMVYIILSLIFLGLIYL